MAYSTLAIVAMFLPTMAVATEYIVGDDKGWTTNFNYQTWAKDKVFYLGDKLVFRYPEGYHNVFKVNGTAFKNCDIPSENIALTSGNDTIVLKTPRRKWYICGVANHCSSYGQKLAIFVQYPNGWAPAPPVKPWPPAPAPSWVPATPMVPSSPMEPWTPAPAPWTPSVPRSPVEPWAPAPAPWTPSVPRSPVEPWAPAPAPWTPSVPATPSEPWAPTPAPWAPAPSVPRSPTEPWTPAPAAPAEPWAPLPSPYPYI